MVGCGYNRCGGCTIRIFNHFWYIHHSDIGRCHRERSDIRVIGIIEESGIGCKNHAIHRSSSIRSTRSKHNRTTIILTGNDR